MLSDAVILSVPGFAQPFSSFSHLAGAGLFVILGFVLLRGAHGQARATAFLAVYALACVVLFSVSGVYHLLALGGTARSVVERLDHAAIFLLIAGTFTPIHGLLFRGWGRWGILALVWTAAIAGITLKTVFFHSVPEWLGLFSYLALGWLGTVSCLRLWLGHGFRFVSLLLAGGVVYTLGGLCDFLRWPTLMPGVIGPHEACHIAVLVAAVMHWRFIQSRVARHFGDGSVQEAIPRKAVATQRSRQRSRIPG